MDQITALKKLKSKKNVFITGSAGSGKTYLLNKYINYCKKKKINVAITASTGIAATHIGGTTIHSWSGIGIKQGVSEKDLDTMEQRKYLWDRFKKVEVLIIDEISMLHKQILEDVNIVLKTFKRNSKPFGGVQIVLSGDFFQLPPVTKNIEKAQDKFAFMAKSWLEAKMNICYLTEQHRQDDQRLLNLLNEIRNQEVNQDSVEILDELKENKFDDGINAIKLYTHNTDVDLLNKLELQVLKTEERTYLAKTSGKKSLSEGLKKSVLAPEELVLKIDSQVIFVKNHPEGKYMNGTMGKVIEFDQFDLPIVQTISGEKITASEMEWSIVNESGKMEASFSQIPLRLAWAITIHKSQGMTLDRAEIDLSKTFEPGQGYVALSRVKNLSGIKLIDYNHLSLRLNPFVAMADERFRILSEELENHD